VWSAFDAASTMAWLFTPLMAAGLRLHSTHTMRSWDTTERKQRDKRNETNFSFFLFCLFYSSSRRCTLCDPSAVRHNDTQNEESSGLTCICSMGTNLDEPADNSCAAPWALPGRSVPRRGSPHRGACPPSQSCQLRISRRDTSRAVFSFSFSPPLPPSPPFSPPLLASPLPPSPPCPSPSPSPSLPLPVLRCPFPLCPFPLCPFPRCTPSRRSRRRRCHPGGLAPREPPPECLPPLRPSSPGKWAPQGQWCVPRPHAPTKGKCRGTLWVRPPA